MLSMSYTLDMEVLEADLDASEWVLKKITGTFYVGDHHSRYVSALDGKDGLICYNANKYDEISTWFFPRELVV